MNKTLENEKLATSTMSDPRWASILERDKSADGTFYYSVRTTGVYCRPSCAARLARPENVSFFRTIEEAEAAAVGSHPKLMDISGWTYCRYGPFVIARLPDVRAKRGLEMAVRSADPL